MSTGKNTVVVTGGLGAAGAAIAKRLVAEGYNVAILDLPDMHKEAPTTLPGANMQAAFFPLNVTNAAQVEAAMKAVFEKFGAIYGLINCAGLHSKQTIENLEDEEIERVLDVNIKGTVYCCRAAIPYMKQGGKGAIVNLSATCSRMATGKELLFAASKGAVSAFTRELAADVWRYDIRCNTLSPGTFRSSANQAQQADPDWLEDQLSMVLADRLMEPDDVAEVACFLVSEAAHCVNAAEFFLDGAGMYFRDRPEEPGFHAGND